MTILQRLCGYVECSIEKLFLCLKDGVRAAVSPFDMRGQAYNILKSPFRDFYHPSLVMKRQCSREKKAVICAVRNTGMRSKKSMN